MPFPCEGRNEMRWFLNEFARETGKDPALERTLGFRDKLGFDPAPGDGGAGRAEKRLWSNAEAGEATDVVEVFEAVERGLEPRLIRFKRGRGAGVDGGSWRGGLTANS